MGRRERYEPGTFSWVDVTTTDPEGAKSFYTELFGWEVEDMPVPGGSTYSMARVGGDYVAAISPQPEQQREVGVPPNWTNYITVASADETAARAAELGGNAHAEPFDVMEVGRMAVIADPTGAFFAIWEPRRHIGAQRVNDPGCLTWNELSTNDVPAAIEFYSALFGWEVSDLDTGGGPAYWSIGHAGGAGGRNGGMRELAPEQAGVPPHWMPYFTVDSVEDAGETATRLGGTHHVGPLDVGAGRISILGDPQGAVFGVFEGERDD